MRDDLTPEVKQFLVDNRYQQWRPALFTIVLENRWVIRWTDHDDIVSWGGKVWYPGPGINRDKLIYRMGLEADKYKLTFNVQPGFRYAGDDFVRHLNAGLLNSASVQIDEGVARSPGDALVGIIPSRFMGKVAHTKPMGHRSFQIELRSPLSVFDADFPSTVYEPQCPHRLFDGYCRASESAYRIEATLTLVSWDGLYMGIDRTEHPQNHFALGRIRFRTGAASLYERHIKISLNGAIEIIEAPPILPAVGDKVYLWPGCDKGLDTCRSKFNNVVNFGGFPFIPLPETAA